MPVIPTNKRLEKRHDRDNYTTPWEVINLHVDQVDKIAKPNVILDYGAGTGRYGRALREKYPDACIYGVEIRKLDEVVSSSPDEFSLDENIAAYQQIFWGLDLPRIDVDMPAPDLIIGNPPFNVIEAKFDTLTQLLNINYRSFDDFAVISLLLRSNFLESKRRFTQFWPKYPLFKYDFIIDRIAWANHAKGKLGKADYETYAFYHWAFPEDGREFPNFYSELVSYKNGQ